MDDLNDDFKFTDEEVVVDFSKLKKIIESGIEDCIVRIRIEVKINGKLKSKEGTGFFCNIPSKHMKVFITTNHILNQEFLDREKKLILSLKNKQQKEINLELKRFMQTNELYDFTVIEIIKQDNISNFIELDENINSKDYINQAIFTFQFPEGDELSYSHGKIISKKDSFFTHNIGAINGSDGAPVVLMDNLKLIGLHKESLKNGENKEIMNIGIPINLVINNLNIN